MSYVLPVPKYAEIERRSAFYSDLIQRIEAIPGVESAAVTTNLPLYRQFGKTFGLMRVRHAQRRVILDADLGEFFPSNLAGLKKKKKMKRTHAFDWLHPEHEIGYLWLNPIGCTACVVAWLTIRPEDRAHPYRRIRELAGGHHRARPGGVARGA